MVYSCDNNINFERYSKLVYRKIEKTKDELNTLIEKNFDNITSSEVVKLSQELDRLLVKYIKINERVS